VGAVIGCLCRGLSIHLGQVSPSSLRVAALAAGDPILEFPFRHDLVYSVLGSLHLSVSTSTSEGLPLLPFDRLNANVGGLDYDDAKEIFWYSDHDEKEIFLYGDYYDEKEIFGCGDYNEKEIFLYGDYCDEKEIFLYSDYCDEKEIFLYGNYYDEKEILLYGD
jgi:hypothetical protein